MWPNAPSPLPWSMTAGAQRAAMTAGSTQDDDEAMRVWRERDWDGRWRDGELEDLWA